MKLYDFAEDIFTKIGKIIETCIQPHLRFILYLENIINNKNHSKIDINKPDFGVTVKKLQKFNAINNIDEIQNYWENKPFRKESALLDQISVYSMFGFSVKDSILEENKIKFELIYKTKSDLNSRLNKLLLWINIL